MSSCKTRIQLRAEIPTTPKRLRRMRWELAASMGALKGTPLNALGFHVTTYDPDLPKDINPALLWRRTVQLAQDTGLITKVWPRSCGYTIHWGLQAVQDIEIEHSL